MAVVTREELTERIAQAKAEITKIDTEHAGQALPDEVRTKWNDLNTQVEDDEKLLKELDARTARVAALGQKAANAEPERIYEPFNSPKTRAPEDVYDLAAYRKAASSPEQETTLLRDGVKRSIETTRIPSSRISRETAQEAALTTVENLDRRGALAAYMLAVGSPTYRSAFGKFALSSPAPAAFTSHEANAVEAAKGYAERAFTLGSTGLPVPYQLDPTIMPVSNGSVNPFRQISRIVQTTVNEWRGATSAGITAAYATEGTEASDNTPTLAQPAITANRAQAFVPFSIEVGQDWPSIEEEMAREVADAKDDLEATKFTLGTGTNEPQGIIVGASTLVITTTTGAFVVADTYKLEEALPPRFRPRASVIANRFVLNKVRQFDTAGGSGVWLDVPGLAQNLPTGNGLQMPRGWLGYPTYEDSAMDAALTTGSEIAVMGDFRYFVIVDRVGMSADLIPHLVGTNHRPTGQRGLYFFWRNGSEVINPVAFRTLQT